MWMGGAAIAATIIAWGAYVCVTIGTQFLDNGRHEARFIFAAAVYMTVVTMLTFSALMYLMARQGAQYRSRQHTRVPGSRSTPTSPTPRTPSRCWCRPTARSRTWCGAR